MTVSIAELVDKRRLRWAERQDLEYDKKLVRAIIAKVMNTPSLREQIWNSPWLLIELAFTVVDKNRRTLPFFLNEVQKSFIHELETRGTSKPFFVLKGRQQGFTSLITAIQLCFAVVRRNFSGFTVADKAKNTAAIFNDKARSVFGRLDENLKPHQQYNSKHELFFDRLNSSWRIATASGNVARSMTLNFVHLSEVAFFECDLSMIQAGLGEALVENAFIVYETTANGFNQAQQLWKSGACVNLFYPWWLTKEYRSEDWSYLDVQNLDLLESEKRWLSERITLLYELGCDRAQVCWYCKKYVGYLDKMLIRQEYPITATEAFVVSGRSVFDKDIVNNQMVRAAMQKGGRRGYFEYEKITDVIRDKRGEIVDTVCRLENIRFVERADGYIVLHEEPRVKYGGRGQVTHRAPYVIGADTSGRGEDFFAAKCICNLDGKTAATLHVLEIGEDLFAEQLYCLGIYYHTALIGVEINYSTEPTRILRRELGYPNLYYREVLTTEVKDKSVLELGFETTQRTRPIIIAKLVAFIRKHADMEVHEDTLLELLTFVKKKNGRQEAQEGCHDDLVIALAIAHFIAHCESADWKEVSLPTFDFIEKNFSAARGAQNYYSREDY